MPPRGGILSTTFQATLILLFQVMPPRGGIWHGLNIIQILAEFQVMPPRGGIEVRYHRRERDNVSSHAPARGHHSHSSFASYFINCFKSCPREGASFLPPLPPLPHKSFKSCPREGASATLQEEEYEKNVSSHAPARGHPVIKYAAANAEILFQVMPPRGGIHLIGLSNLSP